MYRTRYKLPNGEFQSTQVYAKDDAHLDEVVALRGMGEVRSDPDRYDFIGGFFKQPEMPSELFRAGKYAEANHALIWASMIAVRSGVLTGWDLMNDRGIVHEMAHFLHSETLPSRGLFNPYSGLADRLEAFEQQVPGLHPSWGGDDRSVVYKSRDAFADIYGSFFGRLKEPILPTQVKYKPMTIHQALYLPDDDYIDTAHEAPTAKIGSRDFAKHQRNQGAAVKAKNVAALVAKMKAKKTSSVKFVKEDTYGAKPAEDTGRIILTAQTGKAAKSIQRMTEALRGGETVLATGKMQAMSERLAEIQAKSRANRVPVIMDEGSMIKGREFKDVIIMDEVSYADQAKASDNAITRLARELRTGRTASTAVHDEIQVTIDTSKLDFSDLEKRVMASLMAKGEPTLAA